MSQPRYLQVPGGDMDDVRYGPLDSARRVRLAVCLGLVVLVSAFGPYVSRSLGLRLDHLVVYSVFVGTCALALARRELSLKVSTWVILALWASALAYMLAVSLAFGEAQNSRAVLAALDTQMQPIAVVVLLGLGLRGLGVDEYRAVVNTLLTTVIVMMCANAVLSLASVYTDTSRVVSYFVTTDAVGSSVSSRAASMGRYSGVFNQPGEAGIAYSVSVLGWVYLVVSRGARNWGLRISLVLLVVGGLLTVSKVFVVGGLPLAIIYGLWESSRGHPSRFGRLLLWGGVSASCLASLSGWAGWDYLMRLAPARAVDPDGLLRLYTAGRYGQSGMSAQGLIERTMGEAPLRGFGLGSYAPLDSGYVEFLYQGGLVALLLYVGVLAILLVHAIRAVSAGLSEGRLQLLLWVLVVGGNLGAPVLTVNRASTILWVVLLALMQTSWCAQAETRRLGVDHTASGIASDSV